jgi:hypothetical protein
VQKVWHGCRRCLPDERVVDGRELVPFQRQVVHVEAAISRVTILPTTGPNFAAGSRVSVYVMGS